MELNDIEVLSRTTIPVWNEAQILPLGDIQWKPKGMGVGVERLKAYIDAGMQHPNPWFIGMGDYVDFASPSNRGRLRASLAEGSLYDSAEEHLDFAAEETLQELLEILLPTKGRWLGMLEGHHFWSFADGTTTDTRLCQALEAKFLGTSAMVQVRFAQPPKSKKRASVYNMPSFVIWCHHGRGGGRTAGGPLNQLENVIKAFDADVYLVAHHHRQVATKLPRVRAFFGTSKAFLQDRDIILACTGGYLKGWMEGSKQGLRAGGNYPERGMMNPLSLGGIVITARPHKDVELGSRVDLSLTIP